MVKNHGSVRIGYCINLFIFYVLIVFFVPLNKDLQIKVRAQDLAWVRLPNFKTRRC